jgi:DNA-binding SARP family transcriptional activator
VLAAIALAHPQPISIDRIVDLVWPTAAPATARKTVQNHIARVRHALRSLVETYEQGYRFAPGVVIDRVSTGSNDVPLADLPDTPEIEAHRRRIEAHIVAAEEQHWDDRLAAGASPELVAELHTAVAAEPYRERRWLLLAAAHAALGARRDALQTCSAARRALSDVGLTPGDALRAMEQRLLADERSLPPTSPVAPIAPVVHPHRREPFVGRSFELERLADAWQRVTAHRVPHAVVVHGPAGAGKTRLVDEFCRRLPERTTIVVARHRLDADQAFDPILAAVRPILDVPNPAVNGRHDTAKSAVTEIVRSTLEFVEEHPHVVVLDDVHWASSDEIDVVREAIDGIRTPTLLLLTARPAKDGDDVWASIAAVVPLQHVTIGELSRAELHELVTAARLADPTDVDLVYARTAGLPYYASELLRVARLTGHLDAAEVPSAVRTWMLQRLSSLDALSADVIRSAAVAGPTVDLELLALVTDRPTDEVAMACDRLVEAGLMSADVDTGTIRFGHDLTRNAITESLGPTTLARLHRRVADALTTRPGEAEPALVAHHLVRGGPAVAGRAAAAANRAGHRDLESGAWRGAASWFRTALELTDDDAERARALAGLGRSLVGCERFDESTDVLRQAIDLARSLGLGDVQARATLVAHRPRRPRRRSRRRRRRDHRTAPERARPSGIARRLPAGSREHQVLTCGLERELAIMLLLDDAPDERDPPPRTPARTGPSTRTGRSGRARRGPPRLTLRPARRTGPSRPAHRRRRGVGAPRRARRSGTVAHGALLPTRRRPPLRRPRSRLGCPVRRRRARPALPRPLLELGHSHVAGDRAGQHRRPRCRAEQLAFDAAALRTGIDEAAACLGVNLVNIRLYQGRSGEVIPLLRDAVDAHPTSRPIERCSRCARPRRVTSTPPKSSSGTSPATPSAGSPTTPTGCSHSRCSPTRPPRSAPTTSCRCSGTRSSRIAGNGSS